MKFFIFVLLALALPLPVIGQVEFDYAGTTVDGDSIPPNTANLTIGAHFSPFDSRRSKTDTVLVSCICFEQPPNGTIIFLSSGNAYFSSKRLKRTLTEFRITKSFYPHVWADEFLTTETKWLDNVDHCYILNPASDQVFNER